MNAPGDLLAAQDVVVEFRQGWRKPPVRALDGVSIAVERGETVAVVGESGSGKSTLGNAVLGLVPVRGGTIRYDGQDLVGQPPSVRRRRAGKLQAIFQDPYSSLNPTMRIGDIVSEALRAGRDRRTRAEISRRTEAILDRVRLPADVIDSYPADLSGGQRQRVGIARALVTEPQLVVCDEPVSSLDVSVQAQVLNLLAALQQELGVSYLFISHDLAVVRHVARRVVVLYRGRVMESGPVEQVCARPSHPYTQRLLDATPTLDPHQQRLRRAAREQDAAAAGAGPARPSAGCVFAPRCALAIDTCWDHPPEPRPAGPNTVAACHRIADAARQHSNQHVHMRRGE